MLLTIDIGNTNITLGIHAGDEIGMCWRIATSLERTADEYGLQTVGFVQQAEIARDAISAVAMASVVPSLTGTFVEMCESYLEQTPLVVDAGVKGDKNLALQALLLDEMAILPEKSEQMLSELLAVSKDMLPQF